MYTVPEGSVVRSGSYSQRMPLLSRVAAQSASRRERKVVPPY
ncbi:hypothetical protein [Streptomyces sp. NPDC001568]